MVDSRVTETPLRRSVMGNIRQSIVNTPEAALPVNDDEEERRQARRRTLLQQNTTIETTSIEDNETLKKCMEIYNGNKLSRENAWNLSLIDTLSNLLDRHKTLNNFKVAGTSLEASSKVYGLRVDSIYTDVLRMSAGLNARIFNEQLDNDEDDNDKNAAQNGSDAPLVEGEDGASASEKVKPKKKARKLITTITKNKNSLNARLDTVPLQDPIFGKLNSIVGSINASNRLMTNILPSKESELLLHANYQFWDASELPNDINYLEEMKPTEYVPEQWINADWVVKFQRYEKMQLRPVLNGYAITDTPNPIDRPNDDNDDRNSSTHSNQDFLDSDPEHKEISMAFDINAECEPMPDLDAQPAVLEVDVNDFEEMTNEERTALNYCRGIRKSAVVIDDLRPVDGNSKLEYSYRPMDNISQFWAGPSHWKFKRTRPRSAVLTVQAINASGGSAAQRARRAQQLQAKRRSQLLNFGEFHDDNFLKLDANTKLRKANIQKKWDPRKLKLPTNLKIDKATFFNYEYAPGLKVEFGIRPTYADDDGVGDFGTGFGDDDHGVNDGGDMDMPDIPGCNNMLGTSSLACGSERIDAMHGNDMMTDNMTSALNETVLEIATDFEGAPRQITKVIVPFARRAKVIDMKNLKRCCSQLINKDIKENANAKDVPEHPNLKNEKYLDGYAKFNDIYKHLPEVLTPAMTESLSTSVAFYSVLHLANDLGLRLIPQEDLENFTIRKVLD